MMQSSKHARAVGSGGGGSMPPTILVRTRKSSFKRSGGLGVVMNTFYYYSVNHQSGLPKTLFHNYHTNIFSIH